MEIKELSLMNNLSDNDKENSEMDSIIGGHGYGGDYGHSYDYGHGYVKADCPHPYYPDDSYDGYGYYAQTAGGSGAGKSKWWKDKWWKK